MSRLESLVFLWPCRVYGGSCKTSLFEGVKAGQVVMSFCVAGVALPHILVSEKLSKLVLCDRCDTFASFSEDELDFW